MNNFLISTTKLHSMRKARLHALFLYFIPLIEKDSTSHLFQTLQDPLTSSLPYSGHLFFWPAVVLIGMIVIIISARFLFRLALFIVALLIIWQSIHFVGLAPSPTQFFKKYEIRKNG